MSSLAVFGDQWWTPAARVLGCSPHALPISVAPPLDKHTAGADARLRCGSALYTRLTESRPDLLLDDAGAGLLFVENAPGRADLLHERLGVPLVSHFIDGVPTCLQGLAPELRLQCLMSATWRKHVFDEAHASELAAFGIPAVRHLPMAAWDREYETRPLRHEEMTTPIGFVGSQTGTYFYPQRQAPTRSQLPGVLALAARAAQPELTFFRAYHELQRIAPPPHPDEPLAARAKKIEDYYAAKLFYSAALWIAQRDRYVIFLSTHLPDHFALVGRDWDRAYGLRTRPAFASYEEFLAGFRRCLINVNLTAGNAETGVNMRTFEITAAGGFLLQQGQPELGRYFEVGRECEAFFSERDLLDKCRYYLAHPRQALEIAAAGQRRTLREHLYSHRLRTILGHELHSRV